MLDINPQTAFVIEQPEAHVQLILQDVRQILHKHHRRHDLVVAVLLGSLKAAAKTNPRIAGDVCRALSEASTDIWKHSQYGRAGHEGMTQRSQIPQIPDMEACRPRFNAFARPAVEGHSML